MNIITYHSREDLAQMLAARLAGELAGAIAEQGRATLSVPGGTTPGPVFDVLAQAPLDWARVAVVLNDERWVPETSPRSNTALLRQRLLTGRAAAARLVPLYLDAATPEDGLPELTRGLMPHLPLSVLLLGMGADMHTASLFPGADGLAQALAPDAPPLLALRAAGAGEPRVTLSAPVLAGAGSVHLIITGAEKRAALDRARGLDMLHAPVRLVLDRATIHFAE